MALGQLPPWLNVQPEQFLQAIQAGDAAGARQAEINSRAAQAAAANRMQGQELQLRAALAGMESEKDLAAREQAAQQFAAEQMIRERGLNLDQQREGRLAQYGDERLGLMDAKNQIEAMRAANRGEYDAERLQSARDKLDLASQRLQLDRERAESAKEGKGPYETVYDRDPDTGAVIRTVSRPVGSISPDQLPDVDAGETAYGIKVGEVRKGFKFNGKFPPSDRRAWDKI